MKHVKLLLSISLACLLALGAGASGRCSTSDDWRDKVQSEKIAYLSKAMDLTPAEAQAFWPVYNQAEKEKESMMRIVFDAYGKMKAAVDEGKSDAEIKDLLDAYIKANENAHTVDAKYKAQYIKIVGAAKVAKLYLAEEGFRREQIHRMYRPNPDSQAERPSRNGLGRRSQERKNESE